MFFITTTSKSTCVHEGLSFKKKWHTLFLWTTTKNVFMLNIVHKCIYLSTKMTHTLNKSMHFTYLIGPLDSFMSQLASYQISGIILFSNGEHSQQKWGYWTGHWSSVPNCIGVYMYAIEKEHLLKFWGVMWIPC